jgi:hypothetical protein
MGNHDGEVFQLARKLQAESGAANLADVLDHVQVAEANRLNGLYHNYVDAQGATDLKVGVGVINGLPELETYLQRGTIDLHEVSGVLLCTDGFLWPAPLDESIADREKRFQNMRERIERDGLRGYYRDLRAVQAADAIRDAYPRFKIHDDCTAIFVELERS